MRMATFIEWDANETDLDALPTDVEVPDEVGSIDEYLEQRFGCTPIGYVLV